MRVVTYNVHGCVGVDGRYLPARNAAVLDELRPSLAGLQEVGSAHGPGRSEEQIALFARVTGMASVHGPEAANGAGRFGNVLLTTLPVAAVRRLDLSVEGLEPRGALDVEVELRGSRLRVIVTHLGLRGRERGVQLRRLIDHLRDAPELPTLLLGDFNEWLPASPRLRALRRVFGRSYARPSFPTPRPILSLDRIYVRPKTMRIEVGAHRSPLARIASDHLPVWVVLDPSRV